jgi:hypothetical protein
MSTAQKNWLKRASVELIAVVCRHFCRNSAWRRLRERALFSANRHNSLGRLVANMPYGVISVLRHDTQEAPVNFRKLPGNAEGFDLAVEYC